MINFGFFTSQLLLDSVHKKLSSFSGLLFLYGVTTSHYYDKEIVITAIGLIVGIAVELTIYAYSLPMLRNVFYFVWKMGAPLGRAIIFHFI